MEVGGYACPAFDKKIEHTIFANRPKYVAEVTRDFSAWPDRSVGRSGAEHVSTRIGTIDMSDGERRVVGPHGACAYEDGIAASPQRVHVGSGLGSGDPLTRTIGSGRSAIERCSHLQGHERTTVGAMKQVRPELASDRVGCDTDVDLNSCASQLVDPSASDERVGVEHANHNSPDASLDECLGTWPRSAVVIAWFECREHCAVLERRTSSRGRADGDDLSMWTAWRRGCAAMDRTIGADDDGTNARVR